MSQNKIIQKKDKKNISRISSSYGKMIIGNAMSKVIINISKNRREEYELHLVQKEDYKI